MYFPHRILDLNFLSSFSYKGNLPCLISSSVFNHCSQLSIYIFLINKGNSSILVNTVSLGRFLSFTNCWSIPSLTYELQPSAPKINVNFLFQICSVALFSEMKVLFSKSTSETLVSNSQVILGFFLFTQMRKSLRFFLAT